MKVPTKYIAIFKRMDYLSNYIIKIKTDDLGRQVEGH